MHAQIKEMNADILSEVSAFFLTMFVHIRSINVYLIVLILVYAFL